MTISNHPHVINMVVNDMDQQVVARAIAHIIMSPEVHPLLSIREMLYGDYSSFKQGDIEQRSQTQTKDRKFTKPTSSGHSTLWSNRGEGVDPDLKAYTDSERRIERFSRDSVSQRTTFKISRGGAGMVGKQTQYVDSLEALNHALEQLDDDTWHDVIDQWTEDENGQGHYVNRLDAIGAVMQYGRKVSKRANWAGNGAIGLRAAARFIRGLAHIQRGGNNANPLLSDIIQFDGEYARGHATKLALTDVNGSKFAWFENEMYNGQLKVGPSPQRFRIKFVRNSNRKCGHEAILLDDRLSQEHAERYNDYDLQIFRAIMALSYHNGRIPDEFKGDDYSKTFHYHGIKIFPTAKVMMPCGRMRRFDDIADFDPSNYWASKRLNTRQGRCKRTKGKVRKDKRGRMKLNTRSRNRDKKQIRQGGKSSEARRQGGEHLRSRGKSMTSEPRNPFMSKGGLTDGQTWNPTGRNDGEEGNGATRSNL